MTSLTEIEKHEDSTRVADHAIIMEAALNDAVSTILRLLLN